MPLDRRRFLQGLGGSALGALAAGLPGTRTAAAPLPPGPGGPADLASGAGEAEALAAAWFDTLDPNQRATVALPWDLVDGDRGLLRARVAANWQVTAPTVDSDFYRPDQRALVRGVYEALIDPGWLERYDRKQSDDAGSWDRHLSAASFGDPASGPFLFVLAGRHLTLRAGGRADPAVAFGGPVFYGHATGTWWSGSFVERSHHPGNVFFPQAVAATGLFDLLDGPQRERAQVRQPRDEFDIAFQPPGAQRGLPLAELSPDQRAEAERLLATLVEPFRAADREQVRAALAGPDGLDRSSIAFFEPWYRRGDDVWDSFRLEGPNVAWHFRGDPHVHVWAHVASLQDAPVNAVAIER